MHVTVVLARKGSEVATIRPQADLAEAVRALAEHNVGALVVSGDSGAVEGMVSERDIVRELASSGADTLALRVADVMTPDVVTCTPDDSINDLMAVMTERRIRHVPVCDGDRLVGIISIGDVVKWRMDELQIEADSLRNYVTGGHY